MITRTIVQYVVKENIAQAIQTLHAKIVQVENIYRMMPKMLVVTIMLMIALRVQVVNSKTVQVKVDVKVALVVNIKITLSKLVVKVARPVIIHQAQAIRLVLHVQMVNIKTLTRKVDVKVALVVNFWIPLVTMPAVIVKYASGINIVLHKHQVAHIVLAVNILMMIRVTKPTMIARTIVQYVVKENIAQAIQTLHAKIVPAENIYQMMLAIKIIMTKLVIVPYAHGVDMR